MPDAPLNPSQQVERIREILVGRQLHQVEERLHELEGAVSATATGLQVDDEAVHRVANAQSTLSEETQILRRQLQREVELRKDQIALLNRKLDDAGTDLKTRNSELERYLSAHLENISSAMAARIDARVREILQHLQTEISHWKNQVDRDLQQMRDSSVSRTELKGRFARLASAAMEDDPKPEDGFLL